MLQYVVLVLNTQQHSDNGGGDVVTYDLIAGAEDGVAVLCVKAVLCL